MGIDPSMANAFWIGGIVILGLFIVHRFSNRKNFTKARFERKVGGARIEPEELHDLSPVLKRARIQIVLAALGILLVTVIAFAGIGEDPVGIPVPEGAFDAFR